jgi:hypothetical protein
MPASPALSQGTNLRTGPRATDAEQVPLQSAASSGVPTPTDIASGPTKLRQCSPATNRRFSLLLWAKGSSLAGADRDAETSAREREQPRRPPRLVRPGGAALRRRRPGGRPSPLATNSCVASTRAAVLPAWLGLLPPDTRGRVKSRRWMRPSRRLGSLLLDACSSSQLVGSLLAAFVAKQKSVDHSGTRLRFVPRQEPTSWSSAVVLPDLYAEAPSSALPRAAAARTIPRRARPTPAYRRSSNPTICRGPIGASLLILIPTAIPNGRSARVLAGRRVGWRPVESH